MLNQGSLQITVERYEIDGASYEEVYVESDRPLLGCSALAQNSTIPTSVLNCVSHMLAQVVTPDLRQAKLLRIDQDCSPLPEEHLTEDTLPIKKWTFACQVSL